MELLSMNAIEFLDRCRFNDKSHTERMGLTKLARELYPDPDDANYVPPYEGPPLGKQNTGGVFDD